MLFKVDENLPVEVAELLSNMGHDAKTINDQHLQGVNDKILLERCDHEKRALITLDVDFSNIRTYPPRDHEGIILLRIGNQSKNHVLKTFKKILSLILHEPLSLHRLTSALINS